MPNDSDSPIPTSITLETIEQARDRIAPYIHWTPVFTSETLSGLTGTRLHLKAENLQKTGAFKARGAVERRRSAHAGATCGRRRDIFRGESRPGTGLRCPAVWRRPARCS